MITSTILGLLIPFIGTSLGAACVLFMKNELSVKTTKMLSGFAAGVMIAASVWRYWIQSHHICISIIQSRVQRAI